jgi:hypothetical protein
MTKPALPVLLLLGLAVAGSASAQAPVYPVPAFDASVARPAFVRTHPKLLIDKGHHNFVTAHGRFKAFADVAVNDGFKVFEDSNPFTVADLAGTNVLVIANALGASELSDSLGARPAFTAEECEAVREWVKAGGALLLVADHAPMGAAARPLAERFGVDFRNGYLVDPTLADPSMGASTLLFTTENGGLGAHPIMNGHDPSEAIHRVETFTGQSMVGPPGSVALLKVSDKAIDIMMGSRAIGGSIPASMKRSAKGHAAGIAMTYGKGRVVMFGDAAMLTASVSGPDGQQIKIGMNHAGIDNKQLVLNVLHWLAGVLPPS